MTTRSLQRILRSLFVIAALLVFTASWISPVDAGKFFKPPATYEPGSWYVGATPDNLYPNAPVILFVQGLNSTAQTWWDNNDMYELAYQNGYQTAFVQLYDAGGTARSMWDNGRLLANTIREMYATFRKPFVIVAHSKGGIDTDAALIHYGAYPYVKKVITLGSPHDGAELADLAYSSWAGWLADILGAKSDGTYVLQTGYMQYFRQLTDTHPNAGKTPIVTLAGTKWGSFGSSYYWGGLYLSQFGTNDGVVTVNRAYHPNAPMIAVGGWNHDTIRKGSSTFNIIRQHIPLLTASAQTVTVASVAPPSSLTSSTLTSLASSSSLASPSLPSQLSSLSSSPVSYLSSETINRLSSSFSTSGTQVISTRLSAQTLRPQAVLNGSVYVRGGDAQKKVIETFAVEPSVQSLSLSWLNQGGVKSFTLRDPQGKVQYVQVSCEIDQEWFQGASVTQAAVSHPKPGMWTLEIEQSYASPYLLLAQFASPLNDKFQAKQGIRKWFVTLPDAAKSSIHGAPIWHMAALKYTLEQHTVKKIDRFDLSGIADGTLLELPVPQGLKEDSSKALINYTVDIQGYDEGGFPYNRTLIWSSMP
ncbi:MAG: hypothetical protein BSOLF_0446 [Candidatus Carbobacillus altaicus]|uniref:Uncharacterized protein n=1 Tax=Candidatus Carbonibacillus altaicus TaxID=2163959 RepID=A0A2R6Y5K7_9BACL|nr:MAG: hypothetical protein BSOLF_0446 [Candidatus Carbobacillus altaicus]